MNGEGVLADRKVEIRVRKNGRKDKVIVEKSAAEGLPEGWIKKLEITNRSGRKNRRDPFFIDPKSGYVFHSFKDASRYVQTGDIGHYARKLKASDIEDDDGKAVLLLEYVEKRSSDDLLEKEKNTNIHVRDSNGQNLSSSNEHSENCKLNSDLSIVTSQVLEDLGKKEEAKDPIEKQPIAKRVTRSQAKANNNDKVKDLKRKNPSSSNEKSSEDTVKSRLRSASSQEPKKASFMKEEDIQDSTEKRITRSKAKVKTNELSNSVARRTSKRLAGIELEPTPELRTRTKVLRLGPPDEEPTPDLKTRTKAQRIVPPDNEPMPELKTRTEAQRVVPPDDGTAEKCKHFVDPVATSGLKKMDRPLNKEITKSFNEHFSQKPHAAAAATSMSAEMAVGINKKKTVSKSVGRKRSVDKKTTKTPPIIYELNPVFHLDGYMQKEEMSPVSPLSCQTSAKKYEKTAAGKRLGQSSPKAKLTTSVKATEISHSSDSGKLGNELSNSSVVRGTCSEVMEKNTNSFSSAYNSTLADLWKDPCIAFAIKTLTGESLRLPKTPAISSDPINNQAKQKGVSFFSETSGNVNTCSEKPGFPSAPSGADIWKDPCIDFAIKTLTGAIPIGLDEADAKSKSEGMAITTAATQEAEGRQSKCDYIVQQCNMKNNSVGKPEDLRLTQSFSKD